MAKLIPVPWVRWQKYRVSGVVREQETGRPIPDLMVSVFDKDLFSDDYLGECRTNAEGRFEVRFTDSDFKDLLESHPDLYLCVHVPGVKEPIYDTSAAVRQNAGSEEYYEVEIPKASLPDSDPS